MKAKADTDGYQLDILIQGFPGRMVCHGGLGWSTVALLRGRDRVALVDVGSFNMRKGILGRLDKLGLEPADVTDVLLTHSHYDHSLNWIMFRHANIAIGAREIAWAADEPWGTGPVPELYIRELENWPTLRAAADGSEVLPGITAHAAPGHTPGHLVYVYSGKGRDIVFTGDAAKNRAELLSGRGEATYDAKPSSASIPRPRPADDAKGRAHHLSRQARGRPQGLVRQENRNERADPAARALNVETPCC